MRLYHGGDLEVMRYARKLELSLKFNGWRGLVETLMAMEMKGEKIPQKYVHVNMLIEFCHFICYLSMSWL